MKTLDEVIACLDGCGHIDCDDCPYHYEDEKIEVDDCAQAYKDALHYLKKYQSDKDELDSTRLAYLDVLTDYVALKQYWAEQQTNPPLTWDELKAMEGKPVWVEIEGFPGQWMIVEFWNNVQMKSPFTAIDMSDLHCFMNTIGKTWLAYRKER